MLEEDGLTEADFARLLDLARTGHAYLKLSGAYRIAKKRGYDAVEGLAKMIVDAAPDRAIWGSDWPHIPDSTRDTGELLNLLKVWAPDEAVRRKFLSTTPSACSASDHDEDWRFLRSRHRHGLMPRGRGHAVERVCTARASCQLSTRTSPYPRFAPSPQR